MDERVAETLRAIRRGVERANGFALFTAVCEDDPARYIDALADSMPGVEQRRVRIPPDVDADDLVAALVAAGGAEPVGPLHALGMAGPLLGAGEERGRRFARGVNMSREDWGRKLSAPVVLWLTPRAEGFLGREAPDFMDQRAGLFEFPPNPRPADASHQFDREFRSDDWRGGTDGRWDAEERRARVAELESRIALYRDSDDPKVRTSVANWLGELGNHFLTLGELDKAEEHFRKTLAIVEKLGGLEGMANQYGNLGNLYLTRGELDKAEEHYRKALAIDEKLGRLEGMANAHGNLGNLYKNRGELDQAEEHYRKSLAIDEKLGSLEGMASDYSNLGLLHEARGDVAAALADWRKAVELFRRLGAPHMAEKVQGWIDAAEAGSGGNRGGEGLGRGE